MLPEVLRNCSRAYAKLRRAMYDWRLPCSIVGTIVRDNKYDASIANATANASGVNRYLGGPSRNNTDTNTMLMVRVDTNVGPALRIYQGHFAIAQLAVAGGRGA